MRIAVQLDPIELLDSKKDSSLYLIREALRQGYHVWYYIPQDLYIDCEKVKALCKKLRLANNNIEEDQKKSVVDLDSIDVVMVRNNPPMDIGYISRTHILDRLPSSTLVVNSPKGLRDIPEKLFICSYPEFTPPTVVTQNISVAENFLMEHKDIVLKPLYEYGGKDVKRIKNQNNFHKVFNHMVSQYSTPIILQKFLPGVKDGDKRVMLIDGKITAPFSRIPKNGEIRANTILGSDVKKCSLTKKEEEACAIIGSVIAAQGIIFAGLDLIDGYITEVNVTSVGAIQYANTLYALEGSATIEAMVWECIRNKFITLIMSLPRHRL